ncbi:hypothetical protein D3C71_666670 [compost metagenome]
MTGRPALTPRGFNQSQKSCNTSLVIDMTGFDEAAWCNYSAGIEGYEVTGLDAQLSNIFFALYELVNPNFHIALFAGEISRITIYMDRRVGSQNRPRIYLAAAGMNLTVFVLDTIHRESTNRGDCQSAVSGNRSHHSSQSIHVGAECDPAAVVLTFQR